MRAQILLVVTPKGLHFNWLTARVYNNNAYMEGLNPGRAEGASSCRG